MTAEDSITRAIDAMTDVQRRSVQAAAALVERLVATVDGHEDPDADDAGAAPKDDDALLAFAKLWRTSMTSFAQAIAADEGDEPRIDVSASAPPSPLRVTLTRGEGGVEVWLHNPTAEGIDKLRVHCTTPRAHDGSELAAAVIAIPDAFDLPARSSRGITIAVSAPRARAGVYRGLVLVEGLPEQWLPIEITAP